MVVLALCLLIATVFCAVWYWLAWRHQRRRALDAMRWIDSALAGQGQPAGLHWIAQTRLRIPLRLDTGVFHRAWLLVDLTPSRFPVGWLWSRLRGQCDMITFQADLDLPPAFTLHVHNFRWFARSDPELPSSCAWGFEHTGPFIITTRLEWQREISSAMKTLAQNFCHDLLDVSFQRCSPHFSATLPLATIAPESPTRSCMFRAMRELAEASSSASLS